MNKDTKKWLHIIAFVLVIVGAIDLGLFGIIPASNTGQGFDILYAIFGFSPTLLEVIYLLIGVSGVYLVVTHRGDCKVCAK